MPVTIVGNNTPTAGGVVYGDGTNYVSTSAGTSGQVLQSNGASAPSWVTMGSSAMTLISTQTASTSSSLAWTGLSGYNKYLLIADNVIPSTGADALYLTLGTGATPTYIGNNYYGADMYNASNSGPPQGTAYANATQIDLSGGNSVAGTVALGGYSGVITFINMDANPTADVRMVIDGLFPTGATIYRHIRAAYTINGNTTAKTAIRLAFSTNTIASGRVSLYGISS